MLLNDLYTIEPGVADSLTLVRVKLNPHHVIFKGHFPGQPVLPGVCMLEMIREIFSVKLGLSFRITKSPMIKFLTMIVPEKNPVVHIEINHQEEGGLISANGKFFYENTVFMKYSLELKPF